MLRFDTRPAKIGSSINTRTEKHGDDDVTAFDIPVTFVLGASDLCELLQCSDVVERLFTYDVLKVNETTHRAARAPAIPLLKSLALGAKIPGATVVLSFDTLTGPVELKLLDAKLSKVKLTPMFDGMTTCALAVQTTPDLDKSVLSLFGHMNGDCTIEVQVQDYGAQAQLPLGDPPEPDDDAGDES